MVFDLRIVLDISSELGYCTRSETNHIIAFWRMQKLMHDYNVAKHFLKLLGAEKIMNKFWRIYGNKRNGTALNLYTKIPKVLFPQLKSGRCLDVYAILEFLLAWSNNFKSPPAWFYFVISKLVQSIQVDSSAPVTTLITFYHQQTIYLTLYQRLTAGPENLQKTTSAKTLSSPESLFNWILDHSSIAYVLNRP